MTISYARPIINRLLSTVYFLFHFLYAAAFRLLRTSDITSHSFCLLLMAFKRYRIGMGSWWRRLFIIIRHSQVRGSFTLCMLSAMHDEALPNKMPLLSIFFYDKMIPQWYLRSRFNSLHCCFLLYPEMFGMEAILA